MQKEYADYAALDSAAVRNVIVHPGACRQMYYVGLVMVGETEVHVELRRQIDYLDCETWKYLGRLTCTKADVRKRKQAILQVINTAMACHFKKITVG